MRFPGLKAKRDNNAVYMDLPSTNTRKQYPQNSKNGRQELRAMERDPGTADTPEHNRSRSVGRDTTREFYSGSRYNDSVSKSIASDFDYREDRHVSLPSQMTSPDRELPTSPIVSDVDSDPIEDAPSRRQPKQVHVPTRDFTRSYEDVRRQTHLRSGSQPASDSRQHSSSRRSPPPVHKPTRGRRDRGSEQVSPDATTEHGYGPGDRSSEESYMSHETQATSVTTLPALQTKGPDNSDVQQLKPVNEDDPRSWDLIEPASENGSPTGIYALEKRAEQMFSSGHLRTIFNDPKLLLKFTGFLNSQRPQSIAILIYYLDALKALRAINYANAVAEALEPIRGHDFTQDVAKATENSSLERKAERAFDLLVQEDLPAFIAHTWIQVVSISIQRRITGTLAPHLREASEGLAEVFCLTDPSRADNPIVFTSEEFVRTTQYGMNYVIGRNCRFLQGPRTNPHSVRRLAIANSRHREHTEVFVNYRRDGSPFMNLLMTAPLMDSRGNVRYYIGAQVDVSNLVKECSNLDGLVNMVEKEEDPEAAAEEREHKKDEFQELTEMFNSAELNTVRRYGGQMHKDYVDDSDAESTRSAQGKRRVLLKDSTQEVSERHGGSPSAANGVPPSVKEKINGKLAGVYENYLLIRPAPSLRILFTSPSLRVPGILQSPFLNRIGGSSRVRSDLRAALAEGRGVTAKIRWLTRADEDGEGEGRSRWIHCTPLFGHSGTVGVWMIVLVDEEGSSVISSGKRFRQAPPVSANIGGKEWDPHPVKEQKRLNTYDVDNERRGGSNLRPERDPHAGRSRQNSFQADRSRPASVHSAVGKHGGSPGDVSEFPFQLRS
ncbi:hypothetical protein LTR37_016897 [Vermiconidia calcicola]|uniref:Uncharacterized protein n=1 Tax=Vermiconidia calcicola TaxID=1690605 RepID=A0ACC3MMN5_9PEZI|nr:hypothetical protein LTR37_016897 [Vermiconidia calcicola]